MSFLNAFLKDVRVREFRLLYVLALAAIVGASLSASAESQTERTIIEESSPALHSFSGNYLAGRFAQRQQDWQAAQNYMGTALDYDRNNSEMVQRTFLLALGSGNFGSARALASKVIAGKEGDELARIFMACDAISHDNFKSAMSYLDKLPATGFGQYTKPMLTAWAQVGLGKKAEALKVLSANAPADDPAYRMHAGMIEELSGNMNAAAEHYKAVLTNGVSLHTAVMIANFFERYGQPEIARDIYRGLDKVYPFNPFINLQAHKDPQRVIAPNAVRAADGAALALFDLATLLYEKRAYDSAQIYGSLVQNLAPDSSFARLMMGDIAMLHEQFDKAVASYSAIDADSPVYWIARVRMTEVYEASNQIDKAEAMLTDLRGESYVRVPALVSLGDLYRRHNRYDDAVTAYNEAMAGVGTVTEEQWPIIYARGMAEERLNNWGNAEKDLLQALSFQPDNPMILNFLAYSWANQGVNLTKALEYAKRAVELKPDDGYILDSYGWTLFRLARFQESIVWLEQAVAQVPGDSTVLDHLGDAYWQAGRQNEARFQWNHAHDLSLDPAFQKTVQQKLINGIAPPRQVSSNSDTKL